MDIGHGRIVVVLVFSFILSLALSTQIDTLCSTLVRLMLKYECATTSTVLNSGDNRIFVFVAVVVRLFLDYFHFDLCPSPL